jgi:hypothetical protein
MLLKNYGLDLLKEILREASGNPEEINRRETVRDPVWPWECGELSHSTQEEGIVKAERLTCREGRVKGIMHLL